MFDNIVGAESRNIWITSFTSASVHKHTLEKGLKSPIFVNYLGVFVIEAEQMDLGYVRVQVLW